MAMHLWSSRLPSSFQTLYVDNDSVRFALLRGTGLGCVASLIHNATPFSNGSLLQHQRLVCKGSNGGEHSRHTIQVPHTSTTMSLCALLDESSKAMKSFSSFLSTDKSERNILQNMGEQVHLVAPRVKRVREHCQSFHTVPVRT